MELRYVMALPWIAKVGDSVEYAEFSSKSFGTSRMYEVQQSKQEMEVQNWNVLFLKLSNAEIQLALRDNFCTPQRSFKTLYRCSRWLRKMAIFCSILVCCLFVGSCWRGSAVPVENFLLLQNSWMWVPFLGVLQLQM